MAQRQRVKQKGQQELEEKQLRKKKAGQPLRDQRKASDEGMLPSADLLVELSADRHAALLGDLSSSEEKADIVTQLQQSRGNAYVQQIMQRIQTEKGQGQVLESAIRSEMEVSFGHDFGDVRIHADAAADELAKRLNAEAFTSGKDIFFREGAYQPHSQSGKRLIGHEITHVAQQGAARISRQAAETSPAGGAGVEKSNLSEGGYTGRRMRNDPMDYWSDKQNLFGPHVFQRYTKNWELWKPLHGLVKEYWESGEVIWPTKLNAELIPMAWELLKQVCRPNDLAVIKEKVERLGEEAALAEALYVEHIKHYVPARRLASRDEGRSNFRHYHEWAAVKFGFVKWPYAYHAKK